MLTATHMPEFFHHQHALLSNWLNDKALPMWADAGYDSGVSLFHERLRLDGVPLPGCPRRLMVQARQIYVFSHATLTGKLDARRQLEWTFEALTRHFHHPKLPGRWIFSTNPDGSPADTRCDCYSLAFLLFALAWLYRLQPDAYLIELADEIYGVLDGPLAATGGGVLDGLPSPDGFVRQNPNMHLLEACLALHEATGRSADLCRASSLAQLFSTSLFDGKASALPEMHAHGWLPVHEPPAWYEPGHHFEWVWLLRRLARTSSFDADEIVPLLLQRAASEGLDAEGFAIDRVEIASRRRTPSRRCWGTCEYLKACAAQAEALPHEHDLWAARAARALSALHSGFLATPVPGLWYDRIDHRGNPLSIDVPASSLYHIAMALMEIERVFGTVRAANAMVPCALRPALFLDRDGIINRDVGYPTRPSQIIWLEGVQEAIRFAKDAGYAVVVVSNQSCVARGMSSEANVIALHRWMSERLARDGADVDAWYHCPFQSDGTYGPYMQADHPDRKPKLGMILRAALDLNIDLASSHLIGDKSSDLEAARRAGVAGHLFSKGSLVDMVREVLLASAGWPPRLDKEML